MTDDARSSHIPLGRGEEFSAIRRMLEAWGADASGIGDDAAVLTIPEGERLIASTDATVEGVHFRREWLTPREIGARAAAAALSDLAAMAARPIGLLLALGLTREWATEVEQLALGVSDVAAQMACPIVGGNITRASELSLTITVLGSAVSPLTRDGARPGDTLYVTGVLGGPAAALDALMRGVSPNAADRERFAAPRPRLDEARWLAEHGARAAIDISDGLVADAFHLAAASRTRIMLDVALLPYVAGTSPELAASSGEEYELLVAFSPRSLPDTAAFRERFGLPLTAIGVVQEGEGIGDVSSIVRVDLPPGHDHLS